jgi:glycosyltransferase involved in cell wall biosynthesis
VIVTCYNDGPFIEEALESVISSDFRNTEIIVVDDCSTDRITQKKLDELEKSGIEIIRLTSNKLVGNARNKGITAAKGKYILTLDADDRILPDYIGKAVELFWKKASMWFIAMSGVLEMMIPSELHPTTLFLDCLQEILFRAAVRLLRKAWEMTGGYDTSMKNYEDWEFWVHVAT